MTPKSIFSFLITLFLISSCSKPDKPNIILIMADDLGFETLNVYGGKEYQTPELDRLASDGMVFSKCYSTPLCTPTRVKIMTGKYNYRNYVGFGILDSAQRTFGHRLGELGYKTAIAGKWQLYGNQRQFDLAKQHGTTPSQAGFDEYLLWQVKDRGFRFKSPTLASNSGLETFKNQYGPDLFLNFIEGFIERNRESPFFIYYPMVLTHDPFQATPDHEDFENFNPDSVFVNDTTYFSSNLTYLDKVVGSIRKKVEDVGISSKTLILFIGDNGTDRKVISEYQNRQIKGRKGFPEEYGTHVPFLAYWEGTITAGSTSSSLIDFTDFTTSFLSLAGAKKPADDILDGFDFSSELTGSGSTMREWVFTSYAPAWGKFKKARFVHNGKYKLFDDKRAFDIEQDPNDLKDIYRSLIEEQPELVEYFQSVLDSLK